MPYHIFLKYYQVIRTVVLVRGYWEQSIAKNRAEWEINPSMCTNLSYNEGCFLTSGGKYKIIW